MKKSKFLLVLIALLFVSFGCEMGGTTNNPQKEIDPTPITNPTIEIMNFDQTIMVGDQVELKISSGVNYQLKFDDTYLILENGYLKAKAIGEATVSVLYHNQVYGSFKLKIVERMEDIHITNVPEYLIVNSFYQLENDTTLPVIYSAEENDLLKIKSSGFVSVQNNGAGIVKVKCSLADFPQIYDEVEIKVVAKCNNIIVQEGIAEDIVIGDYYYEYGQSAFASLNQAINKAVPRNDIYVIGKIKEDVTIDKCNVKIYGNLEGAAAGEIDGIINITKEINKVYIANLSFTGNANINLLDGNSYIYIENNHFYDTAVNNSAWVDTNAYTSGIIKLLKNDNYHNHIFINDNLFENIGDCAINASTVLDFDCCGNTFKNFAKDAIRFSDDIVKAPATWRIRSNTFFDGEYCGIFFRTYASNTSDVDHYIEIAGNTFDTVAKVDKLFSASVSFKNYQEGRCEINVSFNSFRNCNKYLFMRNNAKEANQNNYNAFVTYNNFLTEPSHYYFNNLNNSDTVSTNPLQAKLQHNYFVGEVNNNKFIGLKENSDILDQMVENVDPALFGIRHVIDQDKLYNVPEGYIVTSDGATLTDTSFKYGSVGSFNATFKGSSEFHFEFKVVREIELIVKFINIALGEIGYQELDAQGKAGTSGNYTKYGAWYGINPGAWCAMYVSWCAYQAGVPSTIIPRYASVSIGMQWFQDQGLFQYKENYTPKAGDIMFMKSDGASHTGIVLYCDGTTLYTVEGNTSDCCAIRKYNVNYSKITGYGTPLWPYYSEEGYDFSSGNASDGSGSSTT